jgi:hypothetical protein
MVSPDTAFEAMPYRMLLDFCFADCWLRYRWYALKVLILTTFDE